MSLTSMCTAFCRLAYQIGEKYIPPFIQTVKKIDQDRLEGIANKAANKAVDQVSESITTRTTQVMTDHIRNFHPPDTLQTKAISYLKGAGTLGGMGWLAEKGYNTYKSISKK